MSQRPAVTTGDRLAATLVFSIIAHGVLALGVGFAIDDAAPVLPTLDVILVQTHSNEPPDKADFLAQANQSGGGESETPERPSEMQPAPAPNPTPGIAPVPLEAGSPRKRGKRGHRRDKGSRARVSRHYAAGAHTQHAAAEQRVS